MSAVHVDEPCVRIRKATLIPLNVKPRFCVLTRSAQACGDSSVSLVCRGTRFRPGSKKVRNLPPLAQTLLPFEAGDELELDEVWTWVFQRKNKRWLWLALCRRTRQIVAYALGCRGEATCRVLWSRIPAAYKKALCFADVWDAYALTVPPEQLQQSAQRGPTNHLERFNRTLRGRIGRLVRQTASFSKCDHMHEITIQLFLHRYNLEKLTT